MKFYEIMPFVQNNLCWSIAYTTIITALASSLESLQSCYLINLKSQVKSSLTALYSLLYLIVLQLLMTMIALWKTGTVITAVRQTAGLHDTTPQLNPIPQYISTLLAEDYKIRLCQKSLEQTLSRAMTWIIEKERNRGMFEVTLDYTNTCTAWYIILK